MGMLTSLPNVLGSAWRFCFLLTGLMLISAEPLLAQTSNSYPMLMNLQPVAAQVGNTTDHVVSARYNLAGATEVLVSGTGVRGELVPDPNVKPEEAQRNDVGSSKCTVRFTVAADAVPGVRDYRIMTPHGVSTVGQLVVARDPITAEAADNDVRDKAQLVALPATLCGAIEKGEDVDYYRFAVEANTQISFHLRAQRLLNRLHDMQTRIDPLLVLRSAQGKILATNDNYYAGDPLLVYQFAQTGEYLLEVRDVRYQGNADWVYSIEANSRPFVTQLFPLARHRGEAATMALVGYGCQPDEPWVLSSESASSGLERVAPELHGQKLNDVAIWATDLPVVVETPPTVTLPTAATPEHAPAAAGPTPTPVQSVAWPAVVTGRIATTGEIDRFAFTAKAQQRLSLQVIARRAGSALDPVLRVLDRNGNALTEVDDGTFARVNYADSWLENWTVPADGEYLLEIRDLHLRGGEQYTYAIEMQTAEPYFQLEVDTDKTLLAPNMGSVFFVRALRKNGFAGDIQLGVEGLPAGVTATAGRILAGSNDGCVCLFAAAEAPYGAHNINIFGTATVTPASGEPQTLRATAQPLQEYYSPGGGRGNYPVDAHTVSVAKPMDIRAIRLSATDVVLTPGGSQRIQVDVERAADYQGNVTLDVIMQHLEQPYGNTLPPGVRVDVGASKTLLTGTDTQGFITLVAAPDAQPVEKQLVPVLAHVSINFVMKHTFCTTPLTITVKK